MSRHRLDIVEVANRAWYGLQLRWTHWRQSLQPMHALALLLFSLTLPLPAARCALHAYWLPAGCSPVPLAAAVHADLAEQQRCEEANVVDCEQQPAASVQSQRDVRGGQAAHRDARTYGARPRTRTCR